MSRNGCGVRTPETRPASSAQGRPSKRQASVRAWAAACSFDLRLGRVCRCASSAPDVNVRLARRTETVGGRKIAHNLAIRIVSARHAARPPSASIIDRALPVPPLTQRAGWYPRRIVRHGIPRRMNSCQCATSDTNGILHPEIELRNAAILKSTDQSISKNEATAAGMPQREKNEFEPMPSSPTSAQ